MVRSAEEGEARVAPLLKLGTPLVNTVDAMPCGGRLNIFAPYIVDGQRVFMETCWLTAVDNTSIDAFVRAIGTAVSPGCAIFTHEFRGAASRVPVEATAFGLRRNHVLVEILATFADRSNPLDEKWHQRWAQATRCALDPIALPGGYPNLLADDDADRVMKSYGRNANRLIRAKRHYDPDNFFSAIPLPIQHKMAAE